jgi:hypothetical protein
MAATTIKISDETLKAFGATAADFEEKVLASVKAKEKTDEENSDLRARVEKLEKEFFALSARVAKLEASTDIGKITDAIKPALIEAAKDAAKVVASTTVGEAIAKAGVQSVASGAKENTANSPQKPAAEDYKGQWEADATLKDTFLDFASFEAFKKAEAKGQVNILRK